MRIRKIKIQQKKMIDIKDKSAKELLVLLLIVLLIVGIGMFAVNQTLSFYYKSRFLQTPCDLCLDLNKDLKLCQRIENNKQLINISEKINP